MYILMYMPDNYWVFGGPEQAHACVITHTNMHASMKLVPKTIERRSPQLLTMCVCVHTHTHTHMHTHICTRTHAPLFQTIWSLSYFLNRRPKLLVRNKHSAEPVYACMYVCMYVCMVMYVWLCMYVCLCMYVQCRHCDCKRSTFEPARTYMYVCIYGIE